MTLNATEGSDALFSFVANVEFNLDGRTAQISAVGFSIERTYSVLRDRQSKAVPAAAIHEGDWVRIVQTPKGEFPCVHLRSI